MSWSKKLVSVKLGVWDQLKSFRIFYEPEDAGWSSTSSKFSIFQTEKPGFLEIIEVCLTLGVGFCITWLVLSICKKAKATLMSS